MTPSKTPGTRFMPTGRETWALGGILVLSAFLQFFRLDREGLGHPYYAAAVQSMGTGWHPFFYASLDPSGFISVDKPPLGLWLQVAFTKLLGFNAWSLHLPGALASVASVFLLNRLVRRSFGAGAGLLSALMLALTPIAVAVGRNITMDGVLVFGALAAAAFLLRAVESGNPRDLLASALMVGLGFNIKMAQALMIVPALFFTWILFARNRSWTRRIGALAGVGLLAAVVSLAWVLAVDLTPAERRPYVGSSRGNSALELALGHNLKTRILKPDRRGLPGIQSDRPGRSRLPVDAGRTLDARLGPQVSWFLPLVLLGAGLALARRRNVSQNAPLAFWATWALTNAAFFSMTRGVLHPHYLVMMAAPYAALAGIAFVALRSEGLETPGGKWLQAGLIATSALQTGFVLRAGASMGWLTAFTLPALVASIGPLLKPGLGPRGLERLRGAAMILLFFAPAAWSMTPVLWGGHPQLPYAGPRLRVEYYNQMNEMNAKRTRELKVLAKFLKDSDTGRGYLAAVTDAQSIGAALILETKGPVMVLGGFMGLDEAITLEAFQAVVREGRLRYLVSPFGVRERALSGQTAARAPDTPNRRLIEWAMSVGRPVRVPGLGPGINVVDLSGVAVP